MNLSCAVSLQSPETPLENRHDVSLNMKSVLGTMSEPLVIKPYLPSGSLPVGFKPKRVAYCERVRFAYEEMTDCACPAFHQHCNLISDVLRVLCIQKDP